MCLLLSMSAQSYAGLISDITTEKIKYFESVTNASGSTFDWQVSYDISFINQDLTIDVGVFLYGYDAGETLKNIWENSIESIWSNAFDLFDGEFYYDTVFNVDWLNSFSGADHGVLVHQGSGNVNKTNWYTDNPSGQGYNKQGVVAAHEFGHMIGLFDEYPGGATEVIRNDSIMGSNLSAPQSDHYDAFVNWLSSNSGVNSLSLVADNGSHNYVFNVPEPSGLILFLFATVGLVARRIN